MRFLAAAGIAGPAAFTAAWVAGSLRQAGHGVMSVQISGLAAPDAKDPWIMITGFVVLGGCAIVFGHALGRDVAGLAPRLIQVAGALAVAAGALQRVAVTIPLVAVTAVAARLIKLHGRGGMRATGPAALPGIMGIKQRQPD